jgi:hypothetical protein
MALKAKAPGIKEKRLKMFVYGEAGVGKTTAAIMFPKAYIIDCEKGTDFYAQSINNAGSVVLQTLNPDEIKEEIRSLLTEKHEYRTLIIDPITQVYNATQEKWSRTFEKYADSEKAKAVQDFGMRYWGRVKSDFKGLQRMLMALDMNVIVTSHQKLLYGSNMSVIGVGADSMKGDEYLFDLIFRIEKRGRERVAVTIKERAEIGQAKFPDEFVWSYENFTKYYGKEVIEREAAPVVMATPEQVQKIVDLLEIVKVDDDWQDKVFAKHDIQAWDEMNGETISKAIEYLEGKMHKASKKEVK